MKLYKDYMVGFDKKTFKGFYVRWPGGSNYLLDQSNMNKLEQGKW